MKFCPAVVGGVKGALRNVVQLFDDLQQRRSVIAAQTLCHLMQPFDRASQEILRGKLAHRLINVDFGAIHIRQVACTSLSSSICSAGNVPCRRKCSLGVRLTESPPSSRCFLSFCFLCCLFFVGCCVVVFFFF